MELIKIGDQVKLNDLYFEEGYKLFGRCLKHTNNFNKIVKKVYYPDIANNFFGVVILDKDISICYKFIEKILS